MIIFLEEITLQIILWILKFLDILFTIFKSIVGVGGVSINNQSTNIFEYLFSSIRVESIFICLIILSCTLGIIFSAASVIKVMITGKGSVLSILGKFLSSILSMLVMMALVYIIMLIFISLLGIVENIFSVNGNESITSSILSSLIPEYANGYTENEISLGLTVRQLLGDYESGVIFPERWAYNGMVNPDTFLYLPGIVCTLFILVGIILALIKLTKSIYEIILIYLLLPLSLSTIPLDEGDRFRNWRDCFFSRLLVFFSALFSVNILVILLPLLLRVSIPGGVVVNGVFKLILVTSGCLLVLSATGIFERIFIPNVQIGELSSGIFTRAIREAYRYSVGIPIGIGKRVVEASKAKKLRVKDK